MITGARRGIREEARGEGLTWVSAKERTPFRGKFLGDAATHSAPLQTHFSRTRRHLPFLPLFYPLCPLSPSVVHPPSCDATSPCRIAVSHRLARATTARRENSEAVAKHRRRSPFIKSLPPTRLPGFTAFSLSLSLPPS